ncbi:uncharacterized protein [Watersipora subatra]
MRKQLQQPERLQKATILYPTDDYDDEISNVDVDASEYDDASTHLSVEQIKTTEANLDKEIYGNNPEVVNQKPHKNRSEKLTDYLRKKWIDLEQGQVSLDPLFWVTFFLCVLSVFVLLIMACVCLVRLCHLHNKKTVRKKEPIAVADMKMAFLEEQPLLSESNNNNTDMLLQRLVNCKQCVTYHSKHHYASSKNKHRKSYKRHSSS